ncbi:hypothetical protein EJ063_16215 [Vibrio aquaticus]|uniref:Lipoprotein n=1 Tax=Vibrio aquaticus TaxID=2496559 RepID=A0A3S0PLX5_9VIBR|nr:hypothetical protein [Vibrio aquaticus]RTZ14458.1 hypothetical protein EJ063_16215 [Vibrio aquaticus]
MKSVIAVIALATTLAGCADHIAESRGTHIEVVPTTYQFELNTVETKTVSARVDQFVAKYPQLAHNAKWVISTKGKHGEVLYSSAKQQLESLGISTSRIEHQVQSHNARFEFRLSATINQTKLEVCHQEQVGRYGYGSLGCTTDVNRWQSMVNPHNAM